MWLTLHGGGDDPLQFLDEMGMMTLAGKERFAMIAPLHGAMFTVGQDVLPAVVTYFLNKYPALDPSRVYVTGYSMGGGAPLHAINGNARMFAAAVPHAAAIFNTEDETVKLGGCRYSHPLYHRHLRFLRLWRYLRPRSGSQPHDPTILNTSTPLISAVLTITLR